MIPEHDYLDKFGKFLVQCARDPSIWEWEATISGHMIDRQSTFIRDHLLASFSEEQRQVVASLAPYIVDSVLHNLLQSLDEEEEIDITVSIDGETSKTLREISDGLGAEIYSDEGWIARFSDYPEIDA